LGRLIESNEFSVVIIKLPGLCSSTLSENDSETEKF